MCFLFACFHETKSSFLQKYEKNMFQARNASTETGQRLILALEVMNSPTTRIKIYKYHSLVRLLECHMQGKQDKSKKTDG